MNTPTVPSRVRELLVRLADAVVPEPRISGPADVVSLARALGAYDVVYRARSAHGFTEWTPRGPRVVLNWAESEGRRRTVLAHECGHLLFDSIYKPDAMNVLAPDVRRTLRSAVEVLGSEVTDVLHSVDEIDLEPLCDAFAYELILPRVVASHAASKVRTIDDLSDFCDHWRVSMSVAVLGMNRHRGEPGTPKIGVLQTRRTAGNYWMAGSSCGLPQTWRGRVIFGPESGHLMEKMRINERRTEMVSLSNGDGERRVVAQIAKYRERATVMVRSGDLR